MVPLKLYEYKNPDWGRAFTHISDALHKWTPDGMIWVSKMEEAHVAIVHVVGMGEIVHLDMKRPTVIVQHCYFTANPDVADYPNYWEKSLFTTSFHNLPSYTDRKFQFYGMPWGADPDVFKRPDIDVKKDIKIMTTGEIADTECLDKVYNACQHIGHTMYHTGKNFGYDTRYYQNYSLLPEPDFVKFLQRSQYVSALRMMEGFELMAVEGLMCGARPITFSTDTYRWFHKYAYVLDPFEDIALQLTFILEKEPKPIGEEEYKEIVDTFSWKIIMKGFYNKLTETIA